MRPPERKIRTTLKNFLGSKEQYTGCVYILANNEFGILYVGKTGRSLRTRIIEQFSQSERPIGKLLNKERENTDLLRLEILVAPDYDREWLYNAERELIQIFRPLFNSDHLGE